MASLTVQHAKSNTIADWSGTVTVGNSTGGTATVAGSDLVRPSDWNSSHNVTFTPAASDLSSLFSAGAGMHLASNAAGFTYEVGSVDIYEPYPLFAGLSTSFNPGNGTWYVDPVILPYEFYSGKLNRLYSFGTSASAAWALGATVSTGSTGNVTKVGTYYFRDAIYTRVGSNSTALTKAWSTEQQWVFSQLISVTSNSSGGAGTTNLGLSESIYVTFPNAWNGVGGVTVVNSSATAGSSTAVSSMALSKVTTVASVVALQNLFTGGIFIPQGMPYEVPAGELWFAHQVSVSTTRTTDANAYTAGSIISGIAPQLYIMSEGVNTIFKMLGTSNSASTTNFMPGHGFIAAANSSAPATVALSDIVVNATNPRIYFNIQG